MNQGDLFHPAHRAEPIILRPYQRAAVDAVYEHLRASEDNPCVVIPTGGGKTPIIATICRDAVLRWGGRVLVLAHVKELLEQTADKLRRMAPGVAVGIYSAGLNRRDETRPVTVAGIQSIYKRACDFDPFDIVIVDEAHLIPPDGEGMYRQFLAAAKQINPRLRVVGLTATPFRMKSGLICEPGGFLNSVCYEIGVRELIVNGFLSPLITKSGQVRADLSGLHVRGGEFVAEEVAATMDIPELVAAACAEIVQYTAARHSCLIFAASVAHADHIRLALESLGQACGVVFGDTPDADRRRTLDDFQSGRLKYLANVNVLTTGYDATNIDCVSLLRPTNSPGLYYQMVGRGFRLHPGKADCLVLDFAGNVLLHGPVDKITLRETAKAAGGASGDAPAKECPACHALIAAGFSICPDCGFEFPQPESAKHDATASEAGILSGQVTFNTYKVNRVWYSRHVKRTAGQGDPATLRVDYLVGLDTKSEWVCLEHPPGSFPHRKAVAWWKARTSCPVPDDIFLAVEIADAGGLAEALEITVRSEAGEKFDRITDYVLGERPPAESDAGVDAWGIPDDDIPF